MPDRTRRGPGSREVAPPRVAVVTDSTASLPAHELERWGVVVVPLEVVLGGERLHEGRDLDPAALTAALGAGQRVTTSQPSPAAFADAYARAAAGGAREIVSVHLSGDLSGTVRGAQLAALAAPLPVHVVDSRSVAMGLGFAVLSAARLARGGVSVGAPDPAPPVAGSRTWHGPFGRRRDRSPAPAADEPAPLPNGAAVAERARQVAADAHAWFLVDSLDHLRRGGRLSATAAALGTVLGLRPILALRSGRIEVAEKVRTRRAARERLEALVVADVHGRGRARVAVHHLGQPELGAEVAESLRSRLAGSACTVEVCEVSAVLGAHAGPGVLALVVADADAPPAA
ncbi:DegV family protein [Cellulomonas sp. NS3]|uniref:DegV family protein n=1 Tax=Cellulomonas sp. NS3 TaxID=2973977 RepID=UPI0021625E82|nr:DegV family protein [Cellulomonas sp. NS3]